MSGYNVKILADSISEAGHRLTTMEVTFPRIVLAEFNTHRMFSRNSASSRAIPIEKQLERVAQFPFIPEYWGVNQKGMQAKVQLTGKSRDEARRAWITARDAALAQASALLELGVHKQLVNRLLESFMWQTVIVTATEWSNFFALRANPDAQPEIRTIAEMMLEAFNASEPRLIREGDWHLPLIQPDEYDGLFQFSEEAHNISAARCARVSYLTHDGKLDLNADLNLYERLVSGGHMSPLEHVATPTPRNERRARAHMALAVRSYSWEIDGTLDQNEFDLDELALEQLVESTEFNGNFRGWTQLRKMIPNEHDFSLVERS